jgi:hypothetical protein
VRGTLVLAVLTIKSSYARNVEIALEQRNDVPDTLQWWFGDSACWRIRTYALDHDIHTFQIGDSRNTNLTLATANNLKHFGDVFREQHVVKFANCTDRDELNRQFVRIGLIPRMEISAGRFAFWKPDDANYWTQSTPKN